MATIRAERHLAGILAADVVGYSRLIELDEGATLSAVKTLLSDIIAPAMRDRSGRIVKLMGDGVLAEFGSVVDAVYSAITLQKNVASWQADVPPDRRIRLRIGINLGDVVVDGEDLFGDGVIVAARWNNFPRPVAFSFPVPPTISSAASWTHRSISSASSAPSAGAEALQARDDAAARHKVVNDAFEQSERLRRQTRQVGQAGRGARSAIVRRVFNEGLNTLRAIFSCAWHLPSPSCPRFACLRPPKESLRALKRGLGRARSGVRPERC